MNYWTNEYFNPLSYKWKFIAIYVALTDGAAEYTDGISAKG